MAAERDGFAIVEIESGEEIGFVACSKDGPMREKVERGLLMRVDLDRSYVADTREEND